MGRDPVGRWHRGRREHKRIPYLCVCDIPTVLASSRRSKRGRKFAEPAWKMRKEELTFVEAPARDRSPTLIPIGRGGRFCLVEISLGAEARVTMFIPRRDKDGELEVTPCLPGRSYAMPIVGVREFPKIRDGKFGYF